MPSGIARDFCSTSPLRPPMGKEGLAKRKGVHRPMCAENQLDTESGSALAQTSRVGSVRNNSAFIGLACNRARI
jgi:hypothetical protein